MADLTQFRAQYPQYDDLDDAQLGAALQKKSLNAPALGMNVSEGGVQYQQQPNRVWGAVENTLDNMMLGWGDEAVGLDAAVLGRTPDGGWFDYSKPFWDRYAEGREAELAQHQQFAEENPRTELATNIAGGLASPSPFGKIKALKEAPTLLKMMGRGAAEGATTGAIYGAGTAEGSLEDRGRSAVSEALMGGAIGGPLGGMGRIGARKKSPDAGTTTEALEKGAEKAYQVVDDAGVIFAAPTMSKLRDDITADLAKMGYSPEINPQVAGFLRALDRTAGQHTTFKGLEVLRRTAANAMSGWTVTPATRRMMTAARAKMDEMVDLSSNSTVLGGDIDKAAPAVREARDLWSRKSKTEMLQDAFERAKRRASSAGTGGNFDNAARQNVKRILESPRGKSFDDAEREMMEKFVAGGKADNFLRWASRFSPTNALPAMGWGTAAIYGDPLVLGGAGAGFLASKASGNLRKEAQEELITAISAGKKIKPEMKKGRAAIINALTRGAITGTGGAPY